MDDSVIYIGLGVTFLILIILVVIFFSRKKSSLIITDKETQDDDTLLDTDADDIDADNIPDLDTELLAVIDASISVATPETPATPVAIQCPTGYSYKIFESDKKCSDSYSGVPLLDANRESCKTIDSVIKNGCVVKTKDHKLAYLSPRIINTRWDLTENYANVKTIKTKLVKTYSTDFKYASEAEFLKDWKYLELQGGGFTESVRIKENVKLDPNTGLKLGVKVIKEGNIDPDIFKKIKNNTEFKNFKYSTGGIASKISFGYGYYEATYTYAQAMSIDNAFWLTNVYSPTWDGWEIDINEGFVGKTTLDYKGSILKWGNGYSGAIKSVSGKFSSDDLVRVKITKKSNKFGLFYTPDVLVWYVNDKPFLKVTPSNDFNKKLNNKGEKLGFIKGNMGVKFTNGLMKGYTESETNLVNSSMNVTNFTYYS